jgi:hypothetical protein
MARQQRVRRRRIVGVELRGSGPSALLAATVLQAIADLQQDGLLADEARDWLRSPGCQFCLEMLDIPHEPFLQALAHRRLERGTSTRAYWRDAAGA